jgi:hypothetical protein
MSPHAAPVFRRPRAGVRALAVGGRAVEAFRAKGDRHGCNSIDSTKRQDARLGEREPERHGGRKTDAVREVLVHAARIQLRPRGLDGSRPPLGGRLQKTGGLPRCERNPAGRTMSSRLLDDGGEHEFAG